MSSGSGEQGYVDAAKANEDTASRNAAPTHVLLDPRGQIGHLYGAATTPHIFVIKPDGALAYMGGADSIASTRTEDMQQAEPYAREAIQAVAAGEPVPHPITRLSLSKTLSGEDSPELWNRGMLAGDGCDPQAADRGATQLYYVARAA